MTDHWMRSAKGISNTLAAGFSLDELDQDDLEYLAMCLRGLEPNGPEQDVFELTYKHPSTQKLNRELRKLLRAIYTIAEIAGSNDHSSKQACAIVTGCYGRQPYQTSGNARATWLYGLEDVIDGMPDKELQIFDEPEQDNKESNDKLAYKTYVLGFRLPRIFRELYPQTEFGKRFPDGTYWGPGVAFALDFGDSIGFETVNAEVIRKAIIRCAKRKNLFDVTY